MSDEPTQGLGGVMTDPVSVVTHAEPPTPPRPVVAAPAPRFRRRWVVAAVVAILVAGGVTAGFLLTGSSSPSYEPVTVAFGSVSQSVTATGTLQPVTSANVNFQASGTVNSVSVSEGEHVTAGQTLATIGTQNLELNLEEAEANLAGAQATLSSDQTSGASSSTIESDDAQVASDESALTQSHAEVAEATLTAPITGTITTLNLAVGDAVTGSADSGSGGGSGSGSSNQVVIEDLSRFEVSASVSAASVGSVKVGQQALVTPSSSGGPPIVPGTVTAVGTVPTVSSGVATFPITVTVTQSPGALYPGTSANVSIISEQRNNVLVVPSAAVLNEPSGEFVEKLVRGHEVLTHITTGLVGGSETQIASGLRNGDKVALPDSPSSASGAVTGGPGQRVFIGPGGANFKINLSPGGGPIKRTGSSGP